MTSSKEAIQSLYRSLLRQARQFPQYNYREYALRKIKEEFSAAKSITDPQELTKFLEAERESLAQLKRMTKVQELYSAGLDKLVVESEKQNNSK